MCQLLRIDEFAGAARIVLDVPATGNALSSALVAELKAALSSVALATRVLVIASSSSVFCGGFDLAEPSHDDVAVGGRFVAIQEFLDALRTTPAVTVALVDGAAYGAGADVVAACDYRVGSGRARFRFPGTRFGMTLGLRRLAHVVGPERARDLALRAAVVDADAAAALGLLTHLREPDGWVDVVAELVRCTNELDQQTQAMLLRVTRGVDTSSDRELLERAAARPGLATRLADFAGRRSCRGACDLGDTA